MGHVASAANANGCRGCLELDRAGHGFTQIAGKGFEGSLLERNHNFVAAVAFAGHAVALNFQNARRPNIDKRAILHPNMGRATFLTFEAIALKNFIATCQFDGLGRALGNYFPNDEFDFPSDHGLGKRKALRTRDQQQEPYFFPIQGGMLHRNSLRRNTLISRR